MILQNFIENDANLKLLKRSEDLYKNFTDHFVANPAIVFISLTALPLVDMLNTNLYYVVVSNQAGDAYYAIESGAHDFLLTPISQLKFQKVLTHFMSRYLAVNHNHRLNDFFYVRNEIRGKLIKIEFSEIKFIESAHNYILIHTVNGVFTTYMSLSEMESFLPSDEFSRIHKSFIVNNLRIRSVERNQVVLTCKTVVTLGPAYKESFLLKLNQRVLEPVKKVIRNNHTNIH